VWRIKSLKALRDKPGKFSVLFENEAEIVVGSAQVADFELCSGLELSEEGYAELTDALKLSSSKARAMRILGNRNYSALEMERRLVGKGETQETACKTVEWLENIGAINDEEFAEMIVRQYCAKGYGISRIRDELYRRGIPREMWDEALSGAESMDDIAYDFIVSKLRGSRDKVDLRRATDALCRRGFSYEEARTTVSRYLENLEEGEGPED